MRIMLSFLQYIMRIAKNKKDVIEKDVYRNTILISYMKHSARALSHPVHTI